jgi:hypothetical protein
MLICLLWELAFLGVIVISLAIIQAAAFAFPGVLVD